jgi:predicted MFS family arabinose efflux permease
MLFSLVGGLLADLIDRRRLLIWVSISQGLMSVALAWVARVDDPSKFGLVAITFLIGVGQSVFGPTYSALLPSLVERNELSGAISLNSAQMNGSRVLGPVLGAALYAGIGASVVFLFNAASYLLVIWALLTVRLPEPVPDPSGHSGLRRLLGGFHAARADRVVGRSLRTIFCFSLLSLPFIGQLPTLADRNLGIDAKSTQYGILYGCFGLGALLGALSIGTVLSGRDNPRIVRVSLVLFAISLAAFSLVRHPALAYPVVAFVGLAYFTIITALSTVLQEQLDEHNRGRVMALWVMCFGGTVPIGNLLAGPLIEWTSITTVVFAGAVIAVALAAYARVSPSASE